MPRGGVERGSSRAYIPLMPDLTKIATCCYCGNRSVLRLAGKVQHELACGSCGARLHTMKAMPLPARTSAPKPRHTPRPAPRPASKPKKRRSPFKRLSSLIEDIWDEVEDIFD